MTTIMRSATGFQPTEAAHVRQSELCATCHTLVTKALGPKGEVIGELPEQMPFQEWKHSAYAGEERSCQSCHMPVVEEDTPIASVLGAPRKGLCAPHVRRRQFLHAAHAQPISQRSGRRGHGGRDGRGASQRRSTIFRNRRLSCRSIAPNDRRDGLLADVRVGNLTGHKLPTGYPSRRAWLHVTVRDRSGPRRVRIGSRRAERRDSRQRQRRGCRSASSRTTPRSATPDQVQIYESVMRDASGRPTTGLLSGSRYLKDNRLCREDSTSPRPMPRSPSSARRRRMPTSETAAIVCDTRWRSNSADGPFQIDAELRFQVIGFRWADNLRPYKAEETRRFVRLLRIDGFLVFGSACRASSDRRLIRATACCRFCRRRRRRFVRSPVLRASPSTSTACPAAAPV